MRSRRGLGQAAQVADGRTVTFWSNATFFWSNATFFWSNRFFRSNRHIILVEPSHCPNFTTMIKRLPHR
jgi:hypothetical protein